MLVGREEVLDRVRTLLGAGQSVTITGPAGSGRSAVLSAVAAELRPVWTILPAAGVPDPPYAGLADLLLRLEQSGQSRFARLPAPQREALDILLSRREGVPDPLAVRLAVLGLGVEGTVVTDDAYRLDEATRDVLAYALPRTRLRLLATVRSGYAVPPGTAVVALPPLDAEQMARLLEARGYAGADPGRIRSASGGHPGLALALAESPVIAYSRLDLLEPLTPDQRTTLLYAVLAGRPTLRVLRRAGRDGAVADIAAAVRAGLAELEAERVLVPAAAVADALAAAAGPEAVAAAHAALEEAADDEVERVWQRSARDGRPDEALAAELAELSTVARERGEPARAAQLALQAAARAAASTPREHVTGWLIAAADAAGAAGRLDLAQAALALLEELGADRRDLARARLAVADAAGQALDGLDDLLVRAVAEAAGDDRLLAAIHLRRAWRANLADGSPRAAAELAARAAEHARAAGDGAGEALALTMLARMRRVLGDATAGPTLDRALALPATPPQYGRHNSPRYLALRHAAFDDRLAEARTGLLAMLPEAEAAGIAEDLVDLLRNLAEVEVRTGRCAAAREHAHRARVLSEHAGLCPGPSLYTAAVVELAGGTFGRARALAERAVRASRAERDKVYLARAFHVAGQTHLAVRDAARAAECLHHVRELEEAHEVRDPSVLRWHGDLAEALVGAGRGAEAYDLIAAARSAAAGHAGVLAALDRADGVHRSDAGDPAAGAVLLRRSADAFAGLDLPLERGRSLIALAAAERRARHRAAARAAQDLAVEIFTAAGAPSWAALARLGHDSSPAAPALPALTDAEARIVAMLDRGASNREIATALFLSVKTVESALTRIYRRAGVRSRAQLQSLLRG
ncbi:helix-turn-helix transcriptional regulator [Hamadaea tsunoensis]|uniref:helix-turn-helix transcriptional regulator n=1 Tax=Hamadaea tsunoensis TaxID=53368 RepID=UPI000425C8A3|nr:LuxR family transcriptional regulator [Hamadaea tsunoensis]